MAGLFGLAVVVVMVAIGGSDDSSESALRVATTTTAPPPTTTTIGVPPGFWSDYVAVDAVDGNTLTVHSTRGPGHDHSPYDLVWGTNTIVMPADANAPWSASAIEPGAQLYFVGRTVAPGPPRRVVAVRVFP
jgi:hypothetical protein